MPSVADTLENERIEIKLLLEGLYLKYGYDFRDYAGAHLKRRLQYHLQAKGFSSYSEMLHRLIYDRRSFL